MPVGIVGLGLIGGSMARALKQSGYEVYGTDIYRTVLLKARLLDIVDMELKMSVSAIAPSSSLAFILPRQATGWSNTLY